MTRTLHIDLGHARLGFIRVAMLGVIAALPRRRSSPPSALRVQRWYPPQTSALPATATPATAMAGAGVADSQPADCGVEVGQH